jgi:hypothetical protein
MEQNFFNNFLTINVEKTKHFYLDQILISDCCKCEDCTFYVESFIKKPFEIFTLLSKMGVDLKKGLKDDLQKVWNIMHEGEVIHCTQEYKLFGKINSGRITSLGYSKNELGLNVLADFSSNDSGLISIYIYFDKEHKIFR